MSASNRTRLGDIRGTLLTLAIASIVVAGLAWGLAGIFSLQSVLVVFIALVGLSWVTSRTGPISVPFVLTTMAVLLLLAEFVLPPWVPAAFDPFTALVAEFLGTSVRAIDAWQLAVLAVTATLAIWAAEVFIFGRAKKPETITKRVRSKAERLVDTYVTIGRLAIGFGFSVGVIVLSEAGMLLGEIGATIGQSPFAANNLLTVAAGFGVFIWELPVLVDFNPVQFWALAAVALGIATMVKFSD